MAAKEAKISAALDKAVSAALEEATAKGSTVSLEDRLKVIDRAIKLEALKAKLNLGKGFGTQFDKEIDEEEAP